MQERSKCPHWFTPIPAHDMTACSTSRILPWGSGHRFCYSQSTYPFHPSSQRYGYCVIIRLEWLEAGQCVRGWKVVGGDNSPFWRQEWNEESEECKKECDDGNSYVYHKGSCGSHVVRTKFPNALCYAMRQKGECTLKFAIEDMGLHSGSTSSYQRRDGLGELSTRVGTLRRGCRFNLLITAKSSIVKHDKVVYLDGLVMKRREIMQGDD